MYLVAHGTEKLILVRRKVKGKREKMFVIIKRYARGIINASR